MPPRSPGHRVELMIRPRRLSRRQATPPLTLSSAPSRTSTSWLQNADEVALRDEIASHDARIRELRSGRGQAGGAGGGAGGGAHGSAGGSLGAAGSSDYAPPPAPYLALTDAYAHTDAPWESHLNPRGGLRAQLARMKEELEAARRELALERASGGGAGADVDWQGVQLSDVL
jgi:hypothetical protein